jgi:hypothetical protein
MVQGVFGDAVVTRPLAASAALIAHGYKATTALGRASKEQETILQ